MTIPDDFRTLLEEFTAAGVANNGARFAALFTETATYEDDFLGLFRGRIEIAAMLQRYDPAKLSHGYNQVEGEEIFFIANPGLGLWAHPSRLGTAFSPKLAAAAR